MLRSLNQIEENVVYNPVLLAAAKESMRKQAYQPPAGDPAAAGPGAGMPMDPAAMAGGAGGAGMPMDPAAMAAAAGGAGMPTAPAAMAGGAGMPVDPTVMAAMAAGAPTDPAATATPDAAAAPKAKKLDPAVLDAKLWRIMKLLTTLLQHLEIPIPADVVLGPGPDDAAAQAAGQSLQEDDAAAQAAAAGVTPDAAAGDATGGVAPDAETGPASGQAATDTIPNSAISPVMPIAPAFPQKAGAAPTVGRGISQDATTAIADDVPASIVAAPTDSLSNRTSAFAAMARALNQRFDTQD